MIGRFLDAISPRNNKGYAPITGLTKTAPVRDFQIKASVLGPKSLPGNGQH